MKAFNCENCECCSFTILKTKKINRVVLKCSFLFLTLDRLPVSATYFLYRGIRLDVHKDFIVFMFRYVRPLFYKVVGDWIYYRVDNPCRYLDWKKCRIYNRRPLVCRQADCPLNNPEMERLYYEGWKPYPYF